MIWAARDPNDQLVPTPLPWKWTVLPKKDQKTPDLNTAAFTSMLWGLIIPSLRYRNMLHPQSNPVFVEWQAHFGREWRDFAASSLLPQSSAKDCWPHRSKDRVTGIAHSLLFFFLSIQIYPPAGKSVFLESSRRVWRCLYLTTVISVGCAGCLTRKSKEVLEKTVSRPAFHSPAEQPSMNLWQG